MSHFFLDLPVDNMPVAPYVPAAHDFGFFSPSSIGIEMSADGIVYVFPNAGSYVGGDIVSGIVASGLHKESAHSLLIDIGTNAEIVLGCSDWIMVGAGAAGPALESGISGSGMRAVKGAIYGIDIDPETWDITYKTIGNVEPLGLCGSGMIELVSELFKTGLIDGQGRFTDIDCAIELGSGALGDSKFIVVYEKGDRKISISAKDINNFLRSKAAMFTALHVMVRSLGLCFGDLSRIFVSGAFGTGINTEKAQLIGIVPHVPSEIFEPIGNSSLMGAEMLLMDSGLLVDIKAICSKITYREMNADGDFMREFPGAMFIPHTNPELLL